MTLAQRLNRPFVSSLFCIACLNTGLAAGLNTPVMAVSYTDSNYDFAIDSEIEFFLRPDKDNQLAESSTLPVEPSSSEPSFDPSNFILFPIGLGADGRISITSLLVRGKEDGTSAIAFEQWLVPLDAVMRTLNIEVTSLDNGQWELRSVGLVTHLNPDELQRDPELGLVLSIAEIQTYLGVRAEFSLFDYAIFFYPPWSSTQYNPNQPNSPAPLLTAGIPLVTPPPFTMTFAGQQLNVTGGQDRTTSTQGNLTILGTLLGGSWFMRMNQSSLGDLSSWNISEAQYLFETPSADYAIGSQPTFWQSQNSGTYWGATTIQRWNYEPLINIGTGGFSPDARLQADTVGRDIIGEATPGSVVQLVQGPRTNIIAEVFIDSSGVYRFENVPQGGGYEVLIYPNGQLTAQPNIQNVTFSTLPSQLPAGASVFMASAGLRQQTSDALFGNFNDVSGGVSYRQGISNDVTLGAGVIYDEGILGLGELFYQPSDLPIQLAVSALGGGDKGLSINADFVYEPAASNFRVDLNTDDLSSRFRANWQILPNLGLRATGDTREGAFGLGVTGAFSSPGFSGFASIDYLTNGNLRWNGLARYQQFELSSQGNEVGSNSNLLVKLSKEPSFTDGHFLSLGFETQVTDQANSLLTLGYHYQSDSRAPDGRYQWALDAGFGFGSQGSGPIVSFSTAIFPGLVLRARYEGISTVSGNSTFAIEILPFYNLQANLASNDSRYEYFRHQGGLWIQPFMDTNANGQLDQYEDVFTDNADLLITLNHQTIELFQPQINADGILVRTFPGLYRLDLDPAGYPLDWQPTQTSYGVEVVAGSFTPVLIPFLVSYTVAGVVADDGQQPVGGAIVEAIPKNGGIPITTITNGSGIYYLDNLNQGTYEIRINQSLAAPAQIVIDRHSDTFQQVDLRVQDGGNIQIEQDNESEHKDLPNPIYQSSGTTQ